MDTKRVAVTPVLAAVLMGCLLVLTPLFASRTHVVATAPSNMLESVYSRGVDDQRADVRTAVVLSPKAYRPYIVSPPVDSASPRAEPRVLRATAKQELVVDEAIYVFERHVCGYETLLPNLQRAHATDCRNLHDDDRLRAAHQLFADQQMHMPSVNVGFYETDEPCKGHLGLYQPTEAEAQISICSELAFVLPHELAHAWIHDNVSEATRLQYLELRGLEYWRGADVQWSKRGMEDAARVIQYVLTVDGGPSESPRWSERFEAFELLVGRPYKRQNLRT